MSRGRAIIAVVVAVVATVWAIGARPEPTGDTYDPEPVASDSPRGQPGGQRVAVIWESLRLSDDRHSVTVTTSYPLAGVCVKEADGVTVQIRGGTAVVEAWMRGPELPMPDNVACTMECGFVTQSVTLQEPLPTRVSNFEPPRHAVPGCA